MAASTNQRRVARVRAAFANRIFRRERLDLRVKVLVPNGQRIETVYGRTSDISYGGMGVILTRTMEQGTPVMILFRLPKVDMDIQVPAFVSHRSGLRCGLRFAQLSAEQKLLIQRICRALSA
jgi:c-di-GMP-binding flagellar brake protein YcgR